MSKKRILFITRNLSYPGGTEIFLFKLMIYLTTHHADRIHIYLYETDQHGGFENTYFYKILSSYNIEVFQPAIKSNDFINSKKVNQIIDIINQKNINIVHTMLFNPDFLLFIAKYGSKYVRGLFNNIKSYKNLEKVYPNIFELSITTKKMKSCYWISTKLCDFTVDLEEENKSWKIRKKITDEQLERIVSSHTDLIVSVSKHLESNWSKFNDNIITIPCTSVSDKELLEIQNNRASNYLKKKYFIGDNDVIYTCVSRLVKFKGIDKLIVAFINFLKQHGNCKLIIIGNGSEEKYLKELAGDNKKIIFFGYKSREKIYKVLTLTKFFCHFPLKEGLGISIQEAMFFGKVILASSVGGIPDMVDNNITGKLCKPNSIKNIEKILSWSSQLSNFKYKKMSKQSVNKMMLNFTNEISFEKMVNIYLSKSI